MTASHTSPTWSMGMRLSALAIVALSLIGALMAGALGSHCGSRARPRGEDGAVTQSRTIHIQAPRGSTTATATRRVEHREQTSHGAHTKALTRPLSSRTRLAEIYGRIAELLNGYAVPFILKDAATAAEVVAEDAARTRMPRRRRLWAMAEDGGADVGAVEAALENNFLGALVLTSFAMTRPRTSRFWWPRTRPHPVSDVDRIAARFVTRTELLAAHALGYVVLDHPGGPANLRGDRFDKPYAATDEIGRTGVEAVLRAAAPGPARRARPRGRCRQQRGPAGPLPAPTPAGWTLR